MNIPRYRPVLAKDLHEGDFVIYHDAEHLVVVSRKVERSSGRNLVLKHMASKRKYETVQAPQAVFMRRDRSGPNRAEWMPQAGDVVVYQFPKVAMWQVAVRHSEDWCTSASYRHHLSDLRILSDVGGGGAAVVHTSGDVHPQSYDWAERLGSIVATRDVTEPSAWVRVEDNLWRSTNGIEASDAMIRFEMVRGTYHLVSHVEEP